MRNVDDIRRQYYALKKFTGACSNASIIKRRRQLTFVVVTQTSTYLNAKLGHMLSLVKDSNIIND